MRFFRAAVAWMSGLGLALATTVASAVTEVETRVQSFSGGGSQTLISGTAPLTDQLVTMVGPATSVQDVTSDFGVLELTNDYLSFESDGVGGLSVGLFRDDFNVTRGDPGLIGQVGYIVYQVRAVGILRNQVQGLGEFGAAGGSLIYQVFSTGVSSSPILYTGTLNLMPGLGGFGTEESYDGTPIGVPLEFEHFVIFGSPTEIEVGLSIQGSSGISAFPLPGASHLAVGDLLLVWDGIDEVRDDLGNVITDFTFTSGTNRRRLDSTRS